MPMPLKLTASGRRPRRGRPRQGQVRLASVLTQSGARPVPRAAGGWLRL